jgi:hypothetical protein
MRRRPYPAGWTLQARETGGYGLWEAILEAPDGRRWTGGGLTRQVAEYRALLLARPVLAAAA